MVGHGAKFSQKMELAIAALLSHRSVEDAARAVGINPNTLLSWMREPEFRVMYEEARIPIFAVPRPTARGKRCGRDHHP